MRKILLRGLFVLTICIALAGGVSDLTGTNMAAVVKAASKSNSKKNMKPPALSKKSLSLTAGKSTTVTLKNISNYKSLKWKSSKKDVVSVKKGKKGKAMVMAKKAGSALITASYNGKNYKCKVTVREKKSKEKGITIEKLRSKYPKTKKGQDKAYSYIYKKMKWSDMNAVRDSIYQEIGVSKANKPQYNCWLIANYVCENGKYGSMNVGSWMQIYKDGAFREESITLAPNAIYSLYLQEGVCANYAQITKWLLDGAGITNYLAKSLEHAWNQVKIDGKWYNIDTTWGDPHNYWEWNNIVFYMSPDQFLVTDSLHLNDKELSEVHAKKCKNKRFSKYLYTTVEPENVIYTAFDLDGITYYGTEDRYEYWVTDKWKTL